MFTTRVLIIIFAVICLVVVGELMYLFVYLPMMRNKTATLPATIPASNNEPKYASAAAENYIVRKTDPAQAISPEVEVQFLYILPRFKKGVLTKSTIDNTYEGTVTRWRVNENAQGDAAKIFFTLKGSEGFENDFSFSQKNVDDVATWIQKSDDTEKPITYKDIKVNDTLQVTSAVNLLGKYPNNRISLSFTKL